MDLYLALLATGACLSTGFAAYCAWLCLGEFAAPPLAGVPPQWLDE